MVERALHPCPAHLADVAELREPVPGQLTEGGAGDEQLVELGCVLEGKRVQGAHLRGKGISTGREGKRPCGRSGKWGKKTKVGGGDP